MLTERIRLRLKPLIGGVGYRAYVFVSSQPQIELDEGTESAIVDTGASVSLIPKHIWKKRGDTVEVLHTGPRPGRIGSCEYSYNVGYFHLYLTDGERGIDVKVLAHLITDVEPLVTREEAERKSKSLDVSVTDPMPKVPLILGIHAFLPEGQLVFECTDVGRKKKVKAFMILTNELFEPPLYMVK